MSNVHALTIDPIAYFSMEVGMKSEIPTYSGGLGVLAGDTLKSSADLGLPVIGVTLLHRKGYFHQAITKRGEQVETPVKWNIEDELTSLPGTIKIKFEERSIELRAWRYDLSGSTGHIVPIYFLDSDLLTNVEKDRQLTNQLYGGDEHYRLAQEAILGLGGVKLLSSLGYPPKLTHDKLGIATYHMNEGHAALLTLALLEEHLGANQLSNATLNDLAEIRKLCVFTTHTPVKAGHDSFSKKLAQACLPELTPVMEKLGLFDNDHLNMTNLALQCSRFVNGVAKRHSEVSQSMFPDFKIEPITNGIHTQTWASDPMAKLFDKYVPDWRLDSFNLRMAIELPLVELWHAHLDSKTQLFSEIESRTGEALNKDKFTIGFARRAATYKRSDLLLNDLQQLGKLAAKYHGLQVIYAGKSHPRDEAGKSMIARIFDKIDEAAQLGIKVIYLENYDMKLGQLICSGVDLWLNNPLKPLEASGTSGMKAALNGVPNLSTLDGWWVEGCFEGVTGWEIEDPELGAVISSGDDLSATYKGASNALYAKLESKILPLYYERREKWQEIMRQSIAINGAHFHTQRMVLQYLQLAYKKVS